MAFVWKESVFGLMSTDLEMVLPLASCARQQFLDGSLSQLTSCLGYAPHLIMTTSLEITS